MFPNSSTPVRRVRRCATGAVGFVRALVRTLSFWTAVSLPAAYYPLLVASQAQTWTLLPALLGAHLLALVAGHGHDPGDLRERLSIDEAGDRVPAWRPPR